MPNVEERMRCRHGGESQANQPTNNQNDDAGPAQESLSLLSRVVIGRHMGAIPDNSWRRVLPVKKVNC